VSFTEVLAWTVPPALGVILLIYALVYASGARRAKRYRPGRPFDFTPVWYLASTERHAGRPGAMALAEGAAQPRQLPARPAGEPAVGPILAAQTQGEQQVGGASDRW
jgi:hypothetical protein